MPQLRQNIITGEWVVIAPERAKRPSDFVVSETVKAAAKIEDVFAVGAKVYKQQRLPGKYESDHIYVIPNSYPAFVEDKEKCSNRTYQLEGFYRARPSTGGHDVVIIKEADTDIYTFSTEIWHELFSMAKKRYQYWREDCNAEHSMLIYNHGIRSGASVAHPHAQIFASNIIPNQVYREIQGSEKYFIDNGHNVFQDLIDHEKKEKQRIIAENDEFLAFTFYAARFPFEVWVIAKEDGCHFDQEPETMLHSLGDMMKRVMKMYEQVLNRPHLNFFLHDLPKSIERSEFYRWHIEITPRVGSYGGYELGSGVIIDIISPEEAAEYLRGTKNRS
ncbi:MAG: DUF4931 domain-containing protein [Patescibacteria group bacterium]